MTRKKAPTRCIVIDASVAHAAGSLDSKHPEGILCRDFLLTVRNVCHRMAWSRPLREEWESHQSVFASLWLVSMMKLSKLRPVPEGKSSSVREMLVEEEMDEGVKAILLKDCHLIDAALSTDSLVASLDEKARHHFTALAVRMEELRKVVWVNPTISKERALHWLERGAANQRSRQLGFRRQK